MMDYVKKEFEKEDVKKLGLILGYQLARTYDKEKIDIEFLDDAIIIREKNDKKNEMRAFPINGMAYLYTSK